MSRSFTVIGFWKNDQRHVVGVVEGEQDVMSGVDVTDQGLFAEYVHDAIDADSACSLIHGSMESGDEDEDGHPFEADGSDQCGLCDLTLEEHDA
jgi:hypothetical protein